MLLGGVHALCGAKGDALYYTILYFLQHNVTFY